jgi:acetylornithine deacetylase
MPSLQEILARLVAISTVSSVNPELDQSNLELVKQLEAWLQPAGFHCERVQLDTERPKANLIATLGSGDDGLVLSGHTDTVPCDPALWRSSPWSLELRHERFYGLGTTDMKGFLAVAIEVAVAYHARQLQHPLTLLFTADEESSMLGAQRLVELGIPRGRYALIGEPTGLCPVHMHKGVGMLALEISGNSGHSSTPDAGRNAIDGMRRALNVLDTWRNSLAHRYCNPAFEVPVPTLNFGRIAGGDNANRICGSCTLHFDLRTLPAMQWDALQQELEQQLTQALADSELVWQLRPLDVVIPAFEAAPASAWVRTLEDLTGHTAEAVAFGSEAPFLQQLGMDVVVCGPGDLARAHKPDECVTVAALQRTGQLLHQLIGRVCLA